MLKLFLSIAFRIVFGIELGLRVSRLGLVILVCAGLVVILDFVFGGCGDWYCGFFIEFRIGGKEELNVLVSVGRRGFILCMEV